MIDSDHGVILQEFLLHKTKAVPGWEPQRHRLHFLQDSSIFWMWSSQILKPLQGFDVKEGMTTGGHIVTGIEDICNIIWSGKRSRLETSSSNRLRQHHATMPKLRSSGIFILALPGMIVGCTKCRSLPPGVAVTPSFSAAYRPKDLLMWKGHKLEMSHKESCNFQTDHACL